MRAAAILAAIAATEARRTAEPGLIPLPVIDIRPLFASRVTAASFHQWPGR